MPNIRARASGVKLGFQTVLNGRYQKIVWGKIDYDTDPNRVPGQVSGLIVLNGNIDEPSGNFFIRQPGLYRFNAQAYYAPPPAEVSAYIILRNLGQDGNGNATVLAANNTIKAGEHPSIALDATINVTTPNTYFDFATEYLCTVAGNPSGLNLQTDPIYMWAEISAQQ